jgi:hypothetical protein
MRAILFAMSVSAAWIVIGCGQDAAVDSPFPTTSVNHGGILIPLTDNQAYVELLNGDRLKKGTSYQTTLVAYLLQADQKTASTEVPTSVEVKIGTPKGDQVVALKAAPDSVDSLGNTRFVSQPGPFELRENGGEVTVQVGGKTLSGKFRAPR